MRLSIRATQTEMDTSWLLKRLLCLVKVGLGRFGRVLSFVRLAGTGSAFSHYISGRVGQDMEASRSGQGQQTQEERIHHCYVQDAQPLFHDSSPFYLKT